MSRFFPPPHLMTEKHPVSETLCFPVSRKKSKNAVILVSYFCYLKVQIIFEYMKCSYYLIQYESLYINILNIIFKRCSQKMPYNCIPENDVPISMCVCNMDVTQQHNTSRAVICSWTLPVQSHLVLGPVTHRIQWEEGSDYC
jgi:hypothetical protein